MSGLLGVIVFCGMCICVFSRGPPKYCIFDFETFETNTNFKNLAIDFSRVKISTTKFDSTTYHELVGSYKVLKTIDASYTVKWIVEKNENGNKKMILNGKNDYEYFLINIYEPYLMPITHNNFVSSILPLRPSTYTIAPVDYKEELSDRSRLHRGKYYISLYFEKDGEGAGGLSGNFNVLRD